MATEMPELRVMTQVPVALVFSCEVAVIVIVGGEVTVVEVGAGVVIFEGAV